MPAARIAMKKIREMLRLRFSLNRTHKEIACACDISSSTVSDCLARCRREGLAHWPIADCTDDELERRIYRVDPCKAPERPAPDWAWVHKELRRRDVHVSLSTLWNEYRAANPNGYEYSWFCHEYADWKAILEPVMRQTHRAGQATFVDYAGDKMPVVDAISGEVSLTEIFVAALGASNYTFCEATWSQNSASWLESNTRMVEFFGGVSETMVPDNLKSGVTKACFYDPELNPAYREWAKHYGTAVLPARKRRPQDKAKVENAVLVVERWILAKLRDRTFYSLDDLNQAISELLAELNRRPFQKLPGSREQMYLELDKPALRPLPLRRYEPAEWKRASVHLDYHIQVDGNYYSVPYGFVRERVEVRLTSMVVEILHGEKRIACHQRSYATGAPITLEEHMPPNHREVASWSPNVMRRRAAKIGRHAQALVEGIMERKEHPEQGIRASLGILSLCKAFGQAKVESACERALSYQAFSYKSVRNILEKGLEKGVPPGAPPVPIDHENVRGADHYKELAQTC